jgi:hypothetical protein
MPLLGNNAGVPFVSGGALVLPPEGVACECCPRYDCVPGGIDCQGCVQTDDGPYRSLAECEPECPPQTCVWCVERDVLGPCNTVYATYECTETSCDENGDCLAPEQTVVEGPLKTEDADGVVCFNDVCPDPPDPPPVPDCCIDGDCPACHQCIEGVCVEGCPPGYICFEEECVPPEDYYYCCRDLTSCTGDCTWESAQQAPPPFGDGSFYWLNTIVCESPTECDCISPEDPPTEIGQVTYTSCTSSGVGGSGTGTCQQGPCGPDQELISGPHGSLVECCASCGCSYDCAVPGYYCFPDPLGVYNTLAECEAACQPPDVSGTCCYTIAPYSEDNGTIEPVEGCALVRGCFGIMTFAECESLATETGTNTSWYSEYTDCGLCPVTEEGVCCYAGEDPCATSCIVTDESCCEALSGTYYTAIDSCEDTWPSGADACRTSLGCGWPLSQYESVFGTPYRIISQTYESPDSAYLSCIQSPQWQAGYPEGLVDCDWRWVRDFSRCAGGAAAENHACERFRVMRLSGDTIIDITSSVVDNPDELECCICVRNYGNSPCTGGECIPSPFFADPEADCLP